MKNAPVQKANEGAPDSANSTTKRAAIELCRFIGVVPPDFALIGCAADVCGGKGVRMMTKIYRAAWLESRTRTTGATA